MVWLNFLASIVLQGLFPPTVDSPILHTTNKNSTDSDSDTEHEVQIYLFDYLTSTIAEGFVTLIVSFDGSPDSTLTWNITDGETGVEFFDFTGTSWRYDHYRIDPALLKRNSCRPI